MAIARLIPALLLLALAACGKAEDTLADAATGSPDAGAEPADAASDQVVGTFRVQLMPPVAPDPGYTTVVGKVYDGPTPSLVVWEEAAASGDCKLLTPRVPFCSGGCGSSVCVEDGRCQAYPTARTVGTVTVIGVHTKAGASTFSMSPIANGYQPLEELAWPAFSEGEAITFAASGDSYPAFSVSAKGIAELALTATSLTLISGQPRALTWTAAGQAGVSGVHVKLDISHHGGTKGMISCDTADSGSLTLDAPLVTQLLALGVAGFPTIVVTRSSTGTTAIAQGKVLLSVVSEVEAAVDIPGLVSCNDDGDCPGTQTCQTDLTCK